MSGICSAHIHWQVGCAICEASTPVYSAIKDRAQYIGPAAPAADGRYWDQTAQALADRDTLLAALDPERLTSAINAFLVDLVGESAMYTDREEVEMYLLPRLLPTEEPWRKSHARSSSGSPPSRRPTTTASTPSTAGSSRSRGGRTAARSPGSSSEPSTTSASPSTTSTDRSPRSRPSS